jgi:OmcA/MtrC family decaheme c-type cytochrome
MGRETGSARASRSRLAAAGLCLALLACQQPEVGERAQEALEPGGSKIEIEEAWIDLHGHVVATFTVSERDIPLSHEEVMALGPRFTLATLKTHPVDGFPAWKSQLLTGKQVAAKLPPGGPGTPAALVLTNARQPGFEAPSSLVDLGAGRFRYVFQNALTEFVPEEVVRVGVWLANADEWTEWTSCTFDFRPSSAPVGLEHQQELVLERNCQRCHHLVESESGATGVRICVTCHTWQHSDPDTIDPAALFTTVTPAREDPNPLEFGRMVHRIHRGKDLPTLHRSTWNGSSPTTVPSPTGLPLPFAPYRPTNARSLPYPGRKYAVVGSDGREHVFGRSVTLATSDPTYVTSMGLPVTMNLLEGGMFPRDLRDCGVCHGETPDGESPMQGYVVSQNPSRRTCSGCHPEVWYEASSPAADPVRFPHAGGPQADDAACEGCHVSGVGAPKLYAPIVGVHVAPARARRYNQPYAEIVRVEGLKDGERPKVTFRLYDRVGPIVPTPSAPVPLYEPEGLATGYAGLDPAGANTSYLARSFPAGGIVLKIIGPTRPDYSAATSVLLASGAAGNPDPRTLSTVSGTDEYVYTFTTITIPQDKRGTFAVGIEARRSAAPTFYDRTNDLFLWPYTGETVFESSENVIVYVNSLAGTWPPLQGDPPPVPRRTVIDLQSCLVCHDRIEFHSGQKHDVAWCVTCHTHDETDIDKRITAANAGRQYPGGPVNIAATFDGVEERSTHFKTMIHRIHTGSRKGKATLEGIAPYALYYGKAYFFDRGGFPNDLADCRLCHAGKSFLIEAIPANAPPTRANEHATVWHPTASSTHADGEPSLPPVQAACTGCHASGATLAHAAEKTVGGVETCKDCHEKGAWSVEVAHGLAPPPSAVAATFSSILTEIFVPYCSSCHGATPPRLDGTAAYDELLSGTSTAGVRYVEPGNPGGSNLVQRMRSDMPPGAPLDPAAVDAVEAWILNGAQQ